MLFDADETLYDLKKSEREAFKNTINHRLVGLLMIRFTEP